jgi:cell division protein FtsI/penicillin-binding protein 2
MRAVGLTFATKRPRRWLRVVIALGVVLGVAAIAVVLLVQQVDKIGPPDLPGGQVDDYLEAWAKGDTKAMAAQYDKAPPAPTFAALATSLTDSAPDSRAEYTRTDMKRDKDGDNGTAAYHAVVTVPGFGPIEWDGELRLVRVLRGDKEVWRIHWEPSVLHPDLAKGQRLVFHSTWQPRGSIVAADGSILAGSQQIVKIGLQPDRVLQSLPRIKDVLKNLLGTTPESIDEALNAPGVQPNWFVEVAQVPDDARYANELRPKLAPMDGVFFQHSTGVLAPAGLIGEQLIGRVGEITAERLKELGPPYRVGDLVGLGGLQETFENRLAGRPSGRVTIDSGDEVVKTIQRFAGRNPQPVQITIDPGVQQAADAALAGQSGNLALVAVDTRTGQIRAVVSKPDNGFARALDGAYPPGSTFKIVTSAALLDGGITPTSSAPCPATLTIDGREFRNFEGESSSSLDLAQAFQISCNNAFIGLADKLPSDSLMKAAGLFGFNVDWKLPVPSSAGTFPEPLDRAELAASAIGQGRILASPVQMATVAATVASGTWHAPTLTTQPEPEAHSARTLAPATAIALRNFMASVVQGDGTAAGAGLPPGTFGKTGTAEFGDANPPETHAWFVGYRDNLAFAVVVEGGGVGGRVAAPIAAGFLNSL